MADGASGTALHRHDIVHVESGAGDAIRIDSADEDYRLCILEWIAAGRPFVVRQHGRDQPVDRGVALGLTLPLHAGKRRIALTVQQRVIRCVSPAPALVDAIAHAPSHWRPALARLRHGAEGIGIAFRLFGSAAWQVLTGLCYLTDASDVDLLWHPATHSQLAEGVALLEAWQRETGISVDGEIVFGDDEAVAWREWQQRRNHAHVLVKRLDGPTMRAPQALLHTLRRWTYRDRLCEAST